MVVGLIFICSASVVSAATFSIGDVVEVYNTGSNGLIVRGPNACDRQIGGKFNGDRGTVVRDSEYCNSYTRWKIRWDGGFEGWSAEDWLKKVQTISARIDSYSPSSKITVNKGESFTIKVWFTNTGSTGAYFWGGVTIWDSNGTAVFDSFGQKTYLNKDQQGSNSWSPTINTPGEYWIQFGAWDEAKSKLLDKKPSPSQNLIKVVEPTIVPTVTITATDAIATEAGPTTGIFTVTRTGSTATGLTVNYTTDTTDTTGEMATPNSDYIALSGSVTIPAGSTTATITVTPIDDTIVENDETVTVTLDSNPAYNVGSPNSATVTIISDDGALPNISVAPTPYNFGNVDIGSTSAPKTFTISNTGDADLVIGTITLTGTNASEFSIQNNNCSNQSIALLGSCSLQVVFSPTSAGSKTASLRIPSNDPDMPILNVSLSGGTPPPSTNFGSQTNSGYEAEPVNTALGNYIYEHTDLKIPGRGLSFEFKRSYNSLDSYNGPLGYGWTHSYNIILDDSGSSVTIKWGDGHEDFYTSNGDGTYTPQYGGIYDILVKNGDNTFTLTKKDQTQYDFSISGKLTGITDKNNNSITFTYDASDNLTAIIDTVGRNINFTYDASHRIIQITDPMGRAIGYEYDVNGDMVKLTDANSGVTTFEYDGTHRLTKIVLPKGNTLIENIYDDQDRVMSQINGRGFTTTFDYNTPNTGETTITDPLSHTTIHTHDDAYRLIQETDANWNTTQYAYDENNNRTSVTDKNGNVTSYTYDSMGNVISKTDALGNVTTIVYDSNNNPIQRTDVSGNNTTYAYDANGNLVSTTDSLGNVSSITYNSHGQPLAQTDANGHVTTYGYDSQGNLTQIINALGNITTFNYDGAGRKTSSTDANGYTKSFTYDNNDNLLRVTDPVGGVTAYIYDANGNRTSVTDPRGNTTFYSYDENDLLTAITDSLGNATTYSYDEVDNKVSIQDARGNAAQHTYDGVGNLIQTRDALNNITSFTYDGNGNRLTKTNALGKTTIFTYDSLDRLVRTADPLGNTTQNSYDAMGRLTQVTDAEGRVTQYSYDALGRLLQVRDALNNVTSYSYDNVGNRTSINDALNNTTTFAYDDLNRLITKTDPSGHAYTYAYDGVGNRTSLTDANGHTINYAYDGNNRLTTITYPDATTVNFSYDANDNRIGMVDKYGAYSYQYDELNRLTRYTDVFGKIISYAYDGAGNRTSLTYSDGKVVNYTYDSLNRMSTATDWSGGITSYNYDAGGNLTNIANPNGTTVTYGYDNADRLLSLTNAKSDASNISSYNYTLDKVGNRTQVTRNEPLSPILTSAAISYNYDNDNRLTSSTGDTYTYDANGNMTSKGSDTYNYDYEDRLIQTSIGGVITEYQYDGLGNRTA